MMKYFPESQTFCKQTDNERKLLGGLPGKAADFCFS